MQPKITIDVVDFLLVIAADTTKNKEIMTNLIDDLCRSESENTTEALIEPQIGV